MSVPRVKKPKQGMLTYKQHMKASEDAVRMAQCIMTAAIQDETGADSETLLRILETSAMYAKYYDDHLIKLTDISESIYNSSNGEIDIRMPKM